MGVRWLPGVRRDRPPLTNRRTGEWITPMDIRVVPMTELAGSCREETAKFARREPSQDIFCLELLRRAVVERDEAAWEAVFAQYRGLVLGWIRRHPASVTVAEDEIYWVNRTFERFWSALRAERFAEFHALAALLRYLKLCAQSVLLDEVRARARVHAEEQVGDSTPTNPEALTLGELGREELWRIVEATTVDDQERLVARLCFALDLKPREVYERYPERYVSVADVYRVKRNLLERLRRNPEVRALIQA